MFKNTTVMSGYMYHLSGEDSYIWDQSLSCDEPDLYYKDSVE